MPQQVCTRDLHLVRLAEIEGGFRGVKRFETFIGNKSERLLQDLVASGYVTFKSEVFTPKITWIYLRKERP